MSPIESFMARVVDPYPYAELSICASISILHESALCENMSANASDVSGDSGREKHFSRQRKYSSKLKGHLQEQFRLRAPREPAVIVT